jgi:CRP/FNR family transcriptional regulator, cyclic AMP receptor protein
MEPGPGAASYDFDVPVFSALPPERLQRLLAAGSERRYEHGDAIFRAGELGDELFAILEGAVRIERVGRPVRVLSSGALFGEIAVLDGRERTADVVADTRVRCLVVPRDALREAIEAESGLAWELLGILASRLRES